MATNFDNAPPTVDSFSRPAGGTDTLASVDQATLVNNHSDAIEEIERKQLTESFNAPTAHGNGLTTSGASWVAVWTDYGPCGFVKYRAKVTANWAGTGFITVDLPTGWTCNYETAIAGLCYPMPIAFGLHYPVWLHADAGATTMELLSHPTLTKNVVTGGPGYMTATASTDLLSGPTHGLTTNDMVFIGAASATLPTGLSNGTYYVIASGLTSTAFKVSTTVGGSAVNITADGAVLVNKAETFSVAAPYITPLDGVANPFAFTGDGTAGNQDTIVVSGMFSKNA
jgi:hypothetical protein